MSEHSNEVGLTLNVSPRAMGSILNALTSQADRDKVLIENLYEIISAFSAENSYLRGELNFAEDEVDSLSERLKLSMESCDSLHDMAELLAEENAVIFNTLAQVEVDHEEYARWAESERKILREELEEAITQLGLADVLIEQSVTSGLVDEHKLVSENLQLSKANHLSQQNHNDTLYQLEEVKKELREVRAELTAIIQERNSLFLENEHLVSNLMTATETNLALRNEIHAIEGIEPDPYWEGYPDQEIPATALISDLEAALLEEDGLSEMSEEEYEEYVRYQNWLQSRAGAGV